MTPKTGRSSRAGNVLWMMGTFRMMMSSMRSPRRTGWPVFPRERMIDIPNAGFPTDEEMSWRQRARGMPQRDCQIAMYRARTFARWGDDLVSTDVRAALRAVRYLRHFLIVHEERIVRHARECGFCWDEIGVHLGLERQTVHRRWAARIREGSADLPRIQAPSRERVIDS